MQVLGIAQGTADWISGSLLLGYLLCSTSIRKKYKLYTSLLTGPSVTGDDAAGGRPSLWAGVWEVTKSKRLEYDAYKS